MQLLNIPNNGYTSWVQFLGNFANLESFAKLFRRKFGHLAKTLKLSYIGNIYIANVA